MTTQTGHVTELTQADLDAAHQRMAPGTPEIAEARAATEVRTEAVAMFDEGLSFREVRQRLAAEERRLTLNVVDAGTFWRNIISRRGVLKSTTKGV